MRKIAVIGDCITAAIRAAMPTSTKFCSGTSAPSRFMQRLTTKPRIAPANRVGPKVPPTPPPELVSVIVIILKKSTSRKNSGTPQAERIMKDRTELLSTAISLPASRAFSES